MTFNVWTFLFEVLNFLVLAYLLHRLLYRPLHDAIDARRAATRRAQDEAETAHRDALALQARIEAERSTLERERQQILAASQAEAEAERRRILGETDQAVQRRHAEAEAALKREREDALTVLRAEVVRQALATTRRLLKEAADRSLEEQYVLRLADELQKIPDIERRQVRADWSPEDGAVLESAAAVNGTALERVRAAVSDILGQPIELRQQSRPDLVGGARLRLSGHVWDASLAGQLDETEAPESNHG